MFIFLDFRAMENSKVYAVIRLEIAFGDFQQKAFFGLMSTMRQGTVI